MLLVPYTAAPPPSRPDRRAHRHDLRRHHGDPAARAAGAVRAIAVTTRSARRAAGLADYRRGPEGLRANTRAASWRRPARQGDRRLLNAEINGVGDRGRAPIRAGRVPVLDHDRLAEAVGELLAELSRQGVKSATGGIGHHQGDRPVGIIGCGRRRCRAERRQRTRSARTSLANPPGRARRGRSRYLRPSSRDGTNLFSGCATDDPSAFP